MSSTGKSNYRSTEAIALLDTEGLVQFAGACGAYLEAQFGIAVPGLIILVGWWNVGLLTEGGRP